MILIVFDLVVEQFQQFFIKWHLIMSIMIVMVVMTRLTIIFSIFVFVNQNAIPNK